MRMQLSSSGFGHSYRSFGTGDVLQMFAGSSDPNMRRLSGIQQTLQYGTGQYDQYTQALALNTILSNLKPSDPEYSQVLMRRNAVLLGGPALAAYQTAQDSTNPRLQFAVGALLAVRQFLGI